LQLLKIFRNKIDFRIGLNSCEEYDSGDSHICTENTAEKMTDDNKVCKHARDISSILQTEANQDIFIVDGKKYALVNANGNLRGESEKFSA
jgi:hypothetical protein